MGDCAQFLTIDPEVKKLAASVQKQAALSKNGWAKWSQVARAQTGSEHYALGLSALASLPENKAFFNSTDKVVQLSESGSRLAACAASEPASAPQLVDEIAGAVRQYASRLDPIWLRVRSVSNVARAGGRFVQAIHLDLSEDNFPSETPVKYYPDGASTIYGRVVGQEPDGGVLYVAFDLPVNMPGKLAVDRAFLLTKLADQIQRFPQVPPLVRQFLDGGRTSFITVAHDNAQEVARGLVLLPTSWMRFLWGPPGGGKTYALGRLMMELLTRDPEGRILLVAPSNRAVDVALDQLVRLLTDGGHDSLISGRQLLRYGYPRMTSVMERAELLGPERLDELSRQVRHRAEQLARAGHRQAFDAELAVMRTELLAAQEAVKAAVIEHVAQCRVVATTTTLAYLPSSPIASLAWNTVLVDEVTMVPPATCVFLGSLARDRWILAGDPRQLGPVYEQRHGKFADDYEWLGRDVFDKSGISQGDAQARRIFFADSRLAAITSQRRCTDGIWSHVQYLYPEIHSAVDEAARAAMLARPPLPGRAVVLVDTAAGAVADQCQKAQHSWENPRTAEIALDIAYRLVTETDTALTVAIIAPYRAQVKRLRSALRQQQRSEDPRHRSIDAGTVHQFQGSEADVVIFDLVDGPGRSELGLLLRGDTGLRLVNVAATRARGKLIIVGDRTWFKRTVRRDDNLLLWDLMIYSPISQPLEVSRHSSVDESLTQTGKV